MDASLEPLKARRIYLLLRERIASGEFAPGTRLPGEPALAAEHGVSRVTIRRALDSLAHDGLIDRRVGSGTFVRGPDAQRPIVADFSNMMTHLAEMGRRTGVRLLAFSYNTPPETVAQALGLEPGERTQRSVRVRLIDGKPFSYLTTHVPERIGVAYSEADLANQPLLALLERTGAAVERATQTVSATLATPDVAEGLELEVGSPLLSLTRVVYGPDGSGVEHLHALYRPDRYSLQMDLERAGDAGARRWSHVPLSPPKAANGAAKPAETPSPSPRPPRKAAT